MRLHSTVPEHPRLALGGLGQEIAEVRRVVGGCNPASMRFQAAFLIGLAGDRSPLAFSVIGRARPPALAGVSGEISVGRQPLDVSPEFRREDAHVVARLLQLPGIPPGKNRRPRRSAFGVGRKCISEQQPLAGQFVEVRSLHPLAAVGSGVPVRPVVGNRQQNVRPSGFRRLRSSAGKSNCQRTAARCANCFQKTTPFHCSLSFHQSASTLVAIRVTGNSIGRWSVI